METRGSSSQIVAPPPRGGSFWIFGFAMKTADVRIPPWTVRGAAFLLGLRMYLMQQKEGIRRP